MNRGSQSTLQKKTEVFVIFSRQRPTIVPLAISIPVSTPFCLSLLHPPQYHLSTGSFRFSFNAFVQKRFPAHTTGHLRCCVCCNVRAKFFKLIALIYYYINIYTSEPITMEFLFNDNKLLSLIKLLVAGLSVVLLKLFY